MAKLLEIRSKILQRKKEAKLKKVFAVRDCREKDFFIMDDAYFNGFAKVCGPFATLVYMALCRHAGKDQTCWPSVDLISDRLNISTSTVKRALKTLEDHRIIAVERAKGQPNIYTLTNKRCWVKTPRKVDKNEPLMPVDPMTYVHDEL